MGAVTVFDILVTPLTRVAVVGGDVLHAMKCSDAGYADFGEAYFSLIEQGAIKAWKRHLSMTLNLVMPIGSAKFVFMDEGGIFREEVVGVDRYVRLTVPPGIWFGLQGLAKSHSLILNVADIPHDPDEIERMGIDEIDYVWRIEQ
jgi:dTDP-4-dehydrorhamnose 3,5-epimerase